MCVYLDDVGPSVGGVVGAVERVEAAGEDVRAVAGADDGVHLLHPPPFVQVVQVRAVEVHLAGVGHLDRGAQHVPATTTTHTCMRHPAQLSSVIGPIDTILIRYESYDCAAAFLN